MKTLIIGMGEVGKSHFNILKSAGYEVYGKDLQEVDIPQDIEIMHICLLYDPAKRNEFENIVSSYVAKHKPRIVNNCSTVTPGLTERLEYLTKTPFVHSTTRGLHPNLETGLLYIPKHIGGSRAEVVASYFRKANVRCVIYPRAIMTEVFHLLSNTQYGLNIAFAKEAYEVCRGYNVDYQEFLGYLKTGNQGYENMGYKSLTRMLLYPPGEKIGGHCLVQSAQILSEKISQQLINFIAKFHQKKESQDNNISG